jgi:hypothetical protein
MKTTIMKTINSLSGGKTSSYMAIHYPTDYNIYSLVCIDDKKCAPKDKKIIQMVNDKLEKYGHLQKYGEFIATAEDDKVLKVMFDLENMTGQEIIWIRGKSFDEVNKKQKKVPSMVWRYCTPELKIRPIAEYIYHNIQDPNDRQPVFCNIGIRIDEHERAKKGKDRESRIKIHNGFSKNGRNKWKEVFYAVNNYPLVYDKISNIQVNKFWKDKGIDFPEDSNCIGCFWKHVQQLRKNYDDFPEKMNWFEQQEKNSTYFYKPHINYDQIKTIGLQQEFYFGGGSGCQAGFCTD